MDQAGMQTSVSPPKGYISTSLSYVFCSKLPPHWRCNKSLREPFCVLLHKPIPNGTIVTISAWNEINPNGEVRNATARIHNKIAKFNDLRFVGKSGRDRSFNLRITIDSTPAIVATVEKAIKVTVDGPREPRRKKESPSPVTPSKIPLQRPIRTKRKFPLPTEPQIVAPPPIVNPPTNFMPFLPFGLPFPISSFFPTLPLVSPRHSIDSPAVSTATATVSSPCVSVIVENPWNTT